VPPWIDWLPVEHFDKDGVRARAEPLVGDLSPLSANGLRPPQPWLAHSTGENADPKRPGLTSTEEPICE